MKRISNMKYLYIAATALFTIAVSSCERKFTCTCVYPNQSAGTTYTTIRAYNRSDAKATCADLNEGAKLRGGACAL